MKNKFQKPTNFFVRKQKKIKNKIVEKNTDQGYPGKMPAAT